MTFRGTLRRCFVWLLCLSLCLGLAVPVLAEDNTGTEIRLLQTEGTVNVSSTSGKTYSTREDMRLYNGYIVSTEEASYAWITLDAEKAVKLDECSSLEVRRSGKSLELLLKSGEMYCDVTAPLKEDEKLNIRTSTMVTGVRGTIVYIQKISDDETHLGVLEGRAQGVAINPITGATRALMVRQGQIGVFKVYDADEAGEGADAWLLGMKVDDIPPFVQVQIAQDPAARVRVPKDLQKSLTEALQDLLKKQAETRQKLEEIEELKEEEVISKDPLWEGKQGGDTGSYTITWNIDGRVETTTCKAGTTPGHAAPAKAGYIFIGWSPELAPAEADAAYTAVYIPIDSVIIRPEPEPQPEPEQYTITWIIDGASYTSRYSEGAFPNRAAPTKEGYEFIGWDPEIRQVTGNATYTAIFEEIRYTIIWQDEEGNVFDKAVVEYGIVPSHADPQNRVTDEYTYIFKGWDHEFNMVTGPDIYVARFVKIKNSYDITWKNDDGNIIDVTKGEYGTLPEHAKPGKKSTSEYTYEFAGWDKDIVAVTGPAEYTARFTAMKIEHEKPNSQTPSNNNSSTQQTVNENPTPTPVDEPAEQNKKSYKITWKYEDGTKIDVTTVEEGKIPKHADPIMEATQEYSYEFIGWDREPAKVTGPATYTAMFRRVKKVYNVHFESNGGTDTVSLTAEYGDNINRPADPEKDGYIFEGWYTDKGLTKAYNFKEPVEGDITVYAKWKKEEKQISVVSETDNTVEELETEPADKSGNGIKIAIGIIAGLAALIIAGVVTVLLINRKKKY